MKTVKTVVSNIKVELLVTMRYPGLSVRSNQTSNQWEAVNLKKTMDLNGL